MWCMISLLNYGNDQVFNSYIVTCKTCPSFIVWHDSENSSSIMDYWAYLPILYQVWENNLKI